MRSIRTADPDDKREYPIVITAEEKDKILNAILGFSNGKKEVKIRYNSIPNLELSEDQYEMVIEEFKKKGLVDYIGYDYELLTISSETSNFVQKGGFVFERDLYLLNAEYIEMAFQKMEKELTPNNAAKLNRIIEGARNIGELVIGFKELLGQS